MGQLNNQVALILSTPTYPTDLLTINVNTTYYDQFVVPEGAQQSAQAIPVGELATQFYGPNVNVLYGTEYPPYPNPSPPPG